MESFELSEVREVFEHDVVRVLDQVEQSSTVLLGHPALDVLALGQEITAAFTDVEGAYHAVSGTAALVRMESLAAPARGLELFGRHGELRAQELERQAIRVRHLADACAEGGLALREILELELTGRHEAARQVSDQLCRRLRQVASAAGVSELVSELQAELPDQLPGASPIESRRELAGAPEGSREEHEEFVLDWDTASELGSAGSEPGGLRSSLLGASLMALGPELQEVFQEELRTSLQTLDLMLLRLRRSPADATALAGAARLFHGIKGAAATVGLPALAALAGRLLRRTEQAQVAGALPADGLAELVAGTDRLLRTSGVSFQLSVVLHGPAHDFARDAGVRRAFLAEATETCADALMLVEQPGAGEELETRRRLGEMFDSLRASAMLVGEHGIASAADQVQAACLAATAGWRIVLEECVERIAGRAATGLQELHAGGAVAPVTGQIAGESLDDGWSLPPGRPAVVADPDSFLLAGPASVEGADLAQVFREEARQQLARVAPLATLLSRDRCRGPAGELERIFHSLKGAAATVGLAQTAALAAGVREQLEAVADGRAPVTEEFIASVLAAAQAVARSAGLPVLTPSDAAVRAQPAGAAARADEAARRFFLGELRELCDEASRLVGALSVQPAAPAAQQQLVELFQRVKGSALVVGWRSIADEAEQLEHISGAPASGVPLQLALTQGIARIASLGGLRLGDGPVAELPVSQPGGPRQPVQLDLDPALWEAFLQECSELLAGMDRLIIELERSDEPRQVLQELFRHCHTLKGAVNTIGLGPTGDELHLVEDFLERLLDAATLPPADQLAGVLLEVQESIRGQIAQAPRGYVLSGAPRLAQRMRQLRRRSRPSAATTTSLHPEHDSSSLAMSAGNPSGRAVSDGALALLPSTTSSPRSSGVAAGGMPGSRNASWSASPETDQLERLERRTLRVPSERLDALMNLAGELVVTRGNLLTRVGAIRSLGREMERSRHRLLETVERFRRQREFTLVSAGSERELATGDDGDAARTGAGRLPAVRFTELELDRYDDVNVLARSLAEIADDLRELDGSLLEQLGRFQQDSEALNGIVDGVQTTVTRARMVPVEHLFVRLRLPVRDAAEREGKDVRVVTAGEDVSLDKAIVDALFAPMLHLVRNAVSHGVEAPAGRRAADKAETGTIWISASQQAGRIQVEVRDDGAGLDLEALRRKGIAHGLLPPGVALDDPAVRDLVFASGMSTRDGAAEVAGRGVGCDVVKRTIERLGGTVRVESEAGAGTCFRITLPLTLAITRAVLVAHGAHRYAVPLHFAERVLDTSDVEVVESAGQRRLLLEGESIRVHRLAEHLALGGGEAAGPIVLVRTGEQLVGVQVEAVIGQEEVVVKSLGYVLDGHPLLSGVTMRGSGELVFILDVQGFADTAAQLAAPLLAEPAGALSAASAPALRVLWVDDSLSVRRVAERILEQLGAEVVLAVDGIDAMDKLRAGRFDMVFTDLEMPRRSGYELIAELRYLPSYQHLPIVVVSSRSGAKHVAQARAAGASGFLGKPFTEESVAAMLREHLGRDGRSDAPGAARPAASAAPERQCHGTGPARARGGEP